jgi:hypothetical protein
MTARVLLLVTPVVIHVVERSWRAADTSSDRGAALVFVDDGVMRMRGDRSRGFLKIRDANLVLFQQIIKIGPVLSSDFRGSRRFAVAHLQQAY